MSENIKVRTIKAAYEEIKAMDPGTAITEWAIRTAVTGGYIPSRMVGNKYVVNLKSVFDYFGMGNSHECV